MTGIVGSTGASNSVSQNGYPVTTLPAPLQVPQLDVGYRAFKNRITGPGSGSFSAWTDLQPVPISGPISPVYGPELTMARGLVDAGETLNVMAYNQGGTPINPDWLGSIGNAALIFFRTAWLEHFAAYGEYPRLRAWVHYGFADALDPTDAANLAANLGTWIARVRNFFLAPRLPVFLPWSDGLLIYPHGATAIAQLEAYVAGDADAYQVDNSGLPVEPGDPIHLTSDGIQGLGNRLATAIGAVAHPFYRSPV